MQAYPEINAIEGSASTDIAGAARTVEELGLAGKIQIVGASLSSVCGEYVKDGTIASFSLWDPADAGKAMIALAEAVLEKGDGFLPESCSLPIPGYESLTFENGVFYGNTRVDVNAGNIDRYNY